MTEAQTVHFFGGKGGAGKTTLSTAHALNVFDKNQKLKVLLVSLERNGGLADILKKKLSNKPTKILPGKGEGGLFAVEFLATDFAEPYAKKLRPVLAQSATKGIVMSEDDIAKVLDAGTGQLGEYALWLHLKELADTKEFDAIVVDGLGTSHTVRLFDAPHQLRKMLALVRGERLGKRAMAGKTTPVDGVVQEVETLLGFMKDSTKFAFHVVALAEPVSETQTKWMLANLKERNVHIADVIANQIEEGKSSFIVAARRGLQAPHVRKFQTFGVPVELLERRIVGPRGLDDVKKFAKEWASGKETKALQFSAAEGPPALVRAPSMPPSAAPPLPPTRFIFFVGAGGVGKSSCAAAAAVTLTEKEGPVLLVSTDAAHSLSEVLQNRLTDTETQVKGTKGLYAREIDIPGWFHVLKKRIKEQAERAFGAEAKGQEFAMDREVVRNLLEAAPQGIDELAALMSLTDSLVQERFKRIVVDPAPMSETMRLLDLPAVAKDWVLSLSQIFAKYRAKGLGGLADDLVLFAKHIERFEKAVLNPQEARFVVVTRGEDMSIPVVERHVEYLKSKNLPIERVLVNRVLPKTTCAVTEERRNNELEVAKQIEKKVGVPVTLAPALGRYPGGLRELKSFRTAWYALTAPSKIKAA